MAVYDVEWFHDWGEIVGLIALILGAILATTTGTANIAYLCALLIGILFGQRWFSVRKGPRLHWYIITTGFLLGYMIGSLLYADVKYTIVLFMLGLVIGYFMKKTIIH